jgi:hypothetical protein
MTAVSMFLAAIFAAGFNNPGDDRHHADAFSALGAHGDRDADRGWPAGAIATDLGFAAAGFAARRRGHIDVFTNGLIVPALESTLLERDDRPVRFHQLLTACALRTFVGGHGTGGEHEGGGNGEQHDGTGLDCGHIWTFRVF